MTFAAIDTTTVPIDVSGGVVVRRELFERLNRAGRVTEVSGPAGSGKSVLLRSWIDEAGVAEHAAQVSVPDGDRDPRRFWLSVADALRRAAAEFCGSERTVAEYLLAEVLEQQNEKVRRLLSRTSLLERVSGPLADLLTGGSGGERILHKLEQSGAFVVALDAQRSWFRYQATQDWERAGRLLADHWLDISLNGQAATAYQLITSFPAGALDPAQPGLGAELRALALISLGIAELWSSRLDEAEGHLGQGVALARRIGRPLLEINGLAHWGLAASFRSPALAVQRGRQAIELARQHGWSEEPLVAIAYPMLAGVADLAGRPGRGGTLAHGGGIRTPVRGRAGHSNAVPSGPGGSRDRARP